MYNQNLIFLILTGIIAVSPISAIIFILLDKSIYKKSIIRSKIKTIICPIKSILIKDYLSVKTIMYDKLIIRLEENSNIAKISNIKSKKEESINKSEIKKDKYIKLISEITLNTQHKKTNKIRNTILSFLTKLKINKQSINKDLKLIAKVKEEDNKKISTSIVQNKNTKEVFAYTKGNIEEILKKSTRILKNGEKENLNQKDKEQIINKSRELNQKGQKVIAFAYRAMPIKILENYSPSFTEKELIYVGLISVSHPINSELKEIIKELKKEKIKIIVVSNFKERNTLAIAKKTGIIEKNKYLSINQNKYKKLDKINPKNKDIIFSEAKTSDKNKAYKYIKNKFSNIHKIEKNQVEKFKKILSTIKIQKQVKSNKKDRLVHYLSLKISIAIIFLFIIITKAPLSINPFILLYLEILAFLIELSLRTEKNIKTLSKNTIFIQITKNLILTIVSTALILVFNYLRYGITLFETHNYQLEINQLITKELLIVLTTITWINSLKNIKIRKIHKQYFTILILIINILFIIFASKTPLLQNTLNININYTNYSLVLLVLIAYLLTIPLTKNFIKSIKYAFTKRKISSN